VNPVNPVNLEILSTTVFPTKLFTGLQDFQD
jgi:hypothetical protein